jgi:prepilin-type N-terminal cleavage/methylation domain-containing protein
MQKKIKNEGFTLVELLVVIAIIGLLSTLSIVALNNARMKARDAVRVAAVKQIQTAFELYYNDAGKYPTTTLLSAGTYAAGNPTPIKYNAIVYMTIIPFNPAPRADGSCGDVPFAYATTTNSGSSYTLVYCLGGVTGRITAGSHTATPAGIY